jgi:hypothetical protein
MNTTRLAAAVLTVLAIAGCEGGGVDLNVSTTDNSVDNSTSGSNGNSNNPCASYTPPNSNEVRIGTFDGTNCVYSAAFVGKTNPLLVDVTIPFISGVHIFQDSLFVGQDVTAAAPAGGAGPKLTIAAGNRLAFSNSADYVLINRGSQIFAEGSPAAPITFTAFSDAVTNTAGANDVSLWGGIVVNGNGITNNCTDAERAADQCHVESEGQPSNYGGNDNTESSGVLRYVVVKHSGFEVAPADELNGITFNAVGSGTVVENIQIYSTFDDGLEFFGGAVNVTKAIVLYARDDSLDYSDGYSGTISEGLLIHYHNDGNHCIEGDNIASTRAPEPLDTAPVSAPTFRNLTCITSNFQGGTHGDSQGFLARLGAKIDIEDSIVYSGYGVLQNRDANDVGINADFCFRLADSTTLAFATSGESTTRSSLYACEVPSAGSFPNTDPVSQWMLGANPSTPGSANYSFNTGNVLILDSDNDAVSVLEDGTFYTASTLTNEGGTGFTITPVTAGNKLGAVVADDDWTAPWAFGLREENADEPLWFADFPPTP